VRALNPVRCGFKLDPDTITNYIGRLDARKSRIDIERQRDESQCVVL
jgi:hypothetical protein